MTAIKVPYLGRAGSLQPLPSPNGTFSPVSSKGEVAHGLLSGGTSVDARLNERRTYSLPYSYLLPNDADVLRGFYLRAFGLGPFVFVDPTVRNVLPFDVSNCGVRSQAAHGWAASVGTLARTTGAPVAASGVLAWTGATANATLAPVFDATTAPPCLPPMEAATVSLWVKASSSASFKLQMLGLDPTGAVLNATMQQTLTVSTTWTQMSMTILTSGSALTSSTFLLPRLQAPASGVPTTISIAAAQVEFGTAVTGWQPGFGSPRVLIPSPPGREVQQLGYSDHTFALSEV